MKRLGTALHVVQNKLIVRRDGADLPKIGSVVVDRKSSKIGKVSDIFGPLKRPYIIIRPSRGVDATVHVGSMLYVDESPKRDGKWKR